MTNPNALVISKLIPLNEPIPKPPGTPPAKAAPLPAIAFKILGLIDARPPAAESKLGILPDLIAPKALSIPVQTFSLTPKILDAKTNPAAIPFGFDLSSIRDKASAINV